MWQAWENRAFWHLQGVKDKWRQIITQYKSYKQRPLCSLQSWQSQPPPSFHLASIPFHRLIWKDPQIRHPFNTTNVSQVSNATGTTLSSTLTLFSSPILRPGATNPRAKHQASASSSSSPISLLVKSMLVTVLLTFNASARACGQKR